MATILLKDIPDELYLDWVEYANQTGLPLEYLIREATTYSVRKDRLGVLSSLIVREKKLRKLQHKPTKTREPDTDNVDHMFEDDLSTVDLDEVVPRNI